MSGHFYTHAGEPAHEGGLVLAREKGYFPSVTTIMRIINKEGLNSYRVKQMMEAALTLPRHPGESDDDYVIRLDFDARTHSDSAAELGTIIHSAIQEFYQTGEMPLAWIPMPHRPSMLAVTKELVKWDLRPTWNEVSFANHHLGIGGQVDLIGYVDGAPVIVDFKTQEVREALKSGPPKFTVYPEWAMQLASYRHAISQIPGMEHFKEAACYSMIISTKPSIWGCKIKQWPEYHKSHMDMKRGFRQFLAARALYYATNNLPPPPRKPITFAHNFELLNHEQVS